MEKLAFTRAHLFYVRVIMVIMCVSLIESLCQTAMGQIAVLEYMLSGVHGLLRPSLIVPGNKCCHFPRLRRWWSLSSSENPSVGQLDARAHPRSGREVERADRW
jgi:hypothetical protein